MQAEDGAEEVVDFSPPMLHIEGRDGVLQDHGSHVVPQADAVGLELHGDIVEDLGHTEFYKEALDVHREAGVLGKVREGV